LAGGDIITAVNGTAVTDWNSLTEYLELNTRVGDTITLSIIRGSQPMDITLTLAAQPN
jgi:S1-C subfamily serine protease